MSDTSPSEVHTDPASSVASLGASPAAEITVGTDAAYAPASFVHSNRPLRNISEVRHFFRTNEVPVYFVGATPFNLLGLDRWVRNFSYVTYYDGWDGAHPRVFTPKHKPYVEFQSGEEINNWLLINPEVRAYMSRRAPHGQRPKVAMVFFDAETERICEELGYDPILPAAELRAHLDSKLVTTRLGNEVGAASVPNVLVTVEEYQGLLDAASAAGLGTDLVVQTAYGDSGKTTFFIDDETGWKRNQRDLIGNEMYPEVLTEELRRKAGDLVARLGDRLGAEGYRGFFEVDVLVDTDTDEVYLGSSTLGSAAPPRSPMSPPARTQTSPCSPSTSWSTSMSLSSSTSMRSTPDGENSLRSISGARW